mgnify:FL=1
MPENENKTPEQILREADALLNDSNNLLHDYDQHPPACGSTLEATLNSCGNHLLKDYQNANKVLEDVKEQYPNHTELIQAIEKYRDFTLDKAKLVVALDESLQMSTKDKYATVKAELSDGTVVSPIADPLQFSLRLKEYSTTANQIRDDLVNPILQSLGSIQKLTFNEIDEIKQVYEDAVKTLYAESSVEVETGSLPKRNQPQRFA